MNETQRRNMDTATQWEERNEKLVRLKGGHRFPPALKEYLLSVGYALEKNGLKDSEAADILGMYHNKYRNWKKENL